MVTKKATKTDTKSETKSTKVGNPSDKSATDAIKVEIEKFRDNVIKNIPNPLPSDEKELDRLFESIKSPYVETFELCQRVTQARKDIFNQMQAIVDCQQHAKGEADVPDDEPEAESDHNDNDDGNDSDDDSDEKIVETKPTPAKGKGKKELVEEVPKKKQTKKSEKVESKAETKAETKSEPKTESKAKTTTKGKKKSE